MARPFTPAARTSGAVSLLLISWHLLLSVADAQTVTVRLVEQMRQPLRIETEGSLTDLGAAVSVGGSLQEFQNTLIGYENGFFVVGPNTTYHGFKMLDTEANIEGCVKHGAVFAALQGAEALPPIGFTTDLIEDGSAGIILPSNYTLGAALDGSASVPSLKLLSDVGMDEGQVCALQWTGTDGNNTQRIELIAEVRMRPTQTARLEIFEDGDSLIAISSGKLSDLSGLQSEPVLIQDLLDESALVMGGGGFYVSYPGVDSAVFTVEGATSSLRACEGFSLFSSFQLQEGSTLPPFGFDATFAQVIVNLPLNYTAGASMAGTGTVANTSLSDLKIRPGRRCYVEWPSPGSDKWQRLAVVAARSVYSTMYLSFANTVSLGIEDIDAVVIDQSCTAFAARLLGNAFRDISCAVTQGASLLDAIEIQVLVTGQTTHGGTNVVEQRLVNFEL